ARSAEVGAGGPPRPDRYGAIVVGVDGSNESLGSRGLHGLKSLGSVSERVAHGASNSVLVIRGSLQGARRETGARGGDDGPTADTTLLAASRRASAKPMGEERAGAETAISGRRLSRTARGRRGQPARSTRSAGR